MGIFKDILVTLGSIASHLARMNATLTRIAVALEPTPKPEKRTQEIPFEKVEKVDEMLDAGATYREIEAATGVPKSTVGRMNNARERSGKFKETGLYGLDSFKKYGISVGKAADFCKTVGIPVHRINNHGYISAGLAEYVIEKLGTK